MSKGIYPTNRRKLYETVKGMQHAGKTEHEISKILSITPLTIQYLANLFKTGDRNDLRAVSVSVEQRPELAHEMWQAGKSIAEIGEMLQVSTARVRQMVHRYAWTLRHPEFRNNRER
jgi:DNA-binding CsgD family transcriptional regulator